MNEAVTLPSAICFYFYFTIIIKSSYLYGIWELILRGGVGSGNAVGTGTKSFAEKYSAHQFLFRNIVGIAYTWCKNLNQQSPGLDLIVFKLHKHMEIPVCTESSYILPIFWEQELECIYNDCY